MTGLLKFRMSDLLPVIEYTATQKEFSPTFSQAYDDKGNKLPEDKIIVPPGLWLVKDSGCYLMSNAKKGFNIQDNPDRLQKIVNKKYRTDMADTAMWRNKIYEFAQAQQMTPLEYCKHHKLLGTSMNYVVYAEGCTNNESDYENTRQICGGDDFVEFWDLETMQKVSKLGTKYLTIEMTPETMIIKL